MHTHRSLLVASSDYDQYGVDPLFEVDSPEKKLLYSMLKRAIEDFVIPERLVINKSNLKLINKIKNSAHKWLYDYENMEIGSIRWVLENISNDPVEAHRSIIKLVTSDHIAEWLRVNCVTHRVYPIFRHGTRVPKR